jgi:signal transduction histidine kinase
MKETAGRRGWRLAAGFALVAAIPALVLLYMASWSSYADMTRWEHAAIFALTITIACLGVIMVWSGSRSMGRLQRDMRSVAMGSWDRRKPPRGEIDFLYRELSLIMARIEEQAAAIEKANRELERKVEERTKQLIGAERLSAVGEMAAGIAHEMSNIMMPIMGYAQILRASVQDRELQRKAEIIEECGKRGSGIIERLLLFARQDRSTFAQVKMEEVIGTVEKLMRPGLEEKGIRFIVYNMPVPLVHGNDSQLQQVLANLVINAQQAIKGPRGIIEIQSGARGGEVFVSVKDNGEGMDERRKKEIVRPFFTAREPGDGTGLGLSLSCGIIADHGGRITAESAPGEGAEITVYLPAGGEG